MKNLLADLAGSKKFAALVLGLASAIVTRVGLDESLAQPVSELIAALVGCYLVGQGVADHGKEAAKARMTRDPISGEITK